MKESAIQKQILDWLAVKGILAYRMNTGAMKSEHNGKQRFMRFGVPGQADILAFKQFYYAGPGVVEGVEFFCILPFWIECKAPKGKQSELQKSFQAQVEAHGHRYVIARSIGDLEGLL